MNTKVFSGNIWLLSFIFIWRTTRLMLAAANARLSARRIELLHLLSFVFLIFMPGEIMVSGLLIKIYHSFGVVMRRRIRRRLSCLSLLDWKWFNLSSERNCGRLWSPPFFRVRLLGAEICCYSGNGSDRRFSNFSLGFSLLLLMSLQALKLLLSAPQIQFLAKVWEKLQFNVRRENRLNLICG